MKPIIGLREMLLSSLKYSKPGFQIGCVLGLGLVLSPSTVWAGQIQRNQSTCHPMGRVILSRDPGISNGIEVCANDELIVDKGSRVDLLCPLEGKLFKLQAGRHAVSELCNSSRRTMRRCSQGSSLLCSTLRGKTGTRIRLHSLYGDTFIQSPKSIRWQAIEGAQKYKIFIEGLGTLRTFEQETTTFNLANNHVKFNLGETYLITVEAYQNHQSIGESAFVFNMIPPVREAEVNQYVDEINRFQVSQIERVKLIAGVYMSEQLLHQTIAMLEKHLATTESGEIKLLLGDRYWDAGQPALAEASYMDAIALGQKHNQPLWIQQANQGLLMIGEITANGPTK